MAPTKFLSLSRLWYTIFIVSIHFILLYFSIKLCYINDRLPWPKPLPKIELFFQKISLLTSIVLLLIFIYPSLFRIRNFANDEQTLKIEDFEKKSRNSFCSSLWRHCFSLSSTLHLTMSFLIVISPMLVDAKQISIGLKDSTFLLRTDFEVLFDWSLTSTTMTMAKRSNSNNLTISSATFSIESYTRLSLFNFLLASFVCIIREPAVFWSISKMFSFIYSFAMAMNVVQWSLMFGTFQLLLKNICYNPLESTHRTGYLLVAQPYTAFFLYLLLEFLVFISSITFYYYAYNRFKYHDRKSSCYDRCTHYCPSLIAIVLLLLYTSCKMPLVHDIFLLYIQTRLKFLFVTFIFEIVHVLFILALWIFLTTKADWNWKEIEKQRAISVVSSHGLTVKNTPIQTAAISMPELSGTYSSTTDKASRRLSDNLYQKPYEKIRIFQSEIYYRNRPKDWNLPLNHQASAVMATFDQDEDEDDDENELVVRSPSYPMAQTKMNPTSEIQYRDAIRKTVSSLYKVPMNQSDDNLISQDPFVKRSTPPVPPVKRFTQEQIEAARLRAKKIIIQRQSPDDYTQHHRSATLLISQV